MQHFIQVQLNEFLQACVSLLGETQLTEHEKVHAASYLSFLNLSQLLGELGFTL